MINPPHQYLTAGETYTAVPTIREAAYFHVFMFLALLSFHFQYKREGEILT
jgi:hypothetical protein